MKTVMTVSVILIILLKLEGYNSLKISNFNSKLKASVTVWGVSMFKSLFERKNKV